MKLKRILVPATDGGAITHVSGSTVMRVDTKLTFPGRPLRLVIPQIVAMDFSVGDFGVRRGEDFEASPSWPSERRVPACVYSEAFKELDFELGLPALRAGDVVSFTLCNLNPATRWFSAGWLIESLKDV